MRVLTIIYEFPPIGGGGGQAALDICTGLVNRGHDVHVITAHMDGLPRHENRGGLEVLRVSSARRIAYQADMRAMSGYVMAGFTAGMRHIRAWRPDIIHVHFAVPSGPVARMISRLTGIPYVLTAHLGDVPDGVPEKTDKWFRWVYPFTPAIWQDAARVVTVSEFTRGLARQRYDVDMQVIPNGVSLESLDPGEIIVNTPPRIVFAGRFMLQKNPVQLIQTLEKVKHLDWDCVMLGDGPLRAEMEQEIDILGLGDRFTLPGWVTPQEVVGWFARSDLLFMPSLSEGLPVVGVQSLAMGLAIVASPVGGFIDLVEDGVNGYLVSAPSSAAQRLEELLNDPERLHRYRKASRQMAKRFDINNVVAAYEELFFEVISAVPQGAREA